jgi:hypothetical protein
MNVTFGPSSLPALPLPLPLGRFFAPSRYAVTKSRESAISLNITSPFENSGSYSAKCDGQNSNRQNLKSVPSVNFFKTAVSNASFALRDNNNLLANARM